ncbi:MAG: rhomboid family intramembrane serine protease [Clostridiaceae bacterium]|nr:rhomboid family intramembrane serine protease [Clostridiaceae bacterium]
MWFDKLAIKMRRLAIPSLMKYIVISMGAVFILDFVFSGLLSTFLMFDKAAIWRGQIWRLISFIFIPIDSSPVFIIFTLYFYWLIGESLEREWGVARFNLFYLIGIIGTIIAGLITGFATNYYLNLSLFFAFAILYPNVELRLFFILPVKIKWLAYLDAAYFAYLLIISGWPQRIALLVSLANIALFFWKDACNQINNLRRRRQWRNQFR